MDKPLTLPQAPSVPTAPVAWVLASLALSMLLPSLGTSSANVSLPTLAAVFGASLPQVQWVVLAYLLATTALVIGAGRLGDLFGRRRLLLGGIALFTAASMMCALAPSLPWLVAARAAQGAGAAAMMALTMAFVGEAVPQARSGSAMGLLGTMSAVGTALGPSLGGVLIATFGWQAIFAVNVPLGLLALGLAWRCLPVDQAVTEPRGFDVAGTALLALTLVAYSLAMTFSAWLLAAAALGLALFLRIESRAAFALLRPAELSDPALATGLVTNAVVALVMMTTFVVGPFHLSHALGLGAAAVGGLMSVGPAVSAFSGVPAGRLVDRLGTRRAALAGLAVMLAGCVLLSVLPLSLGAAAYVGAVVVLTPGYALVQAANNTAVMAGADAARRGVVSGLLNLSRNLGLVTGASLMAAVFAAATGSANVVAASAASVARGTRLSFAMAAGLLAVTLLLVARYQGSKQS